MSFRLASAAIIAIAGSSAATLAQSDTLPDVIVRQSDLFDNDFSTNIEPGRIHLRLSNGTANIGIGKLHLYGGADNGDGTQQVIQRVFRDDGSFWERTAGNFIYHPTHNHIHFEAWGQYRLREILPGDGVGPIVAQGEKTSFCIIDLGVHDSELPGFLPNGEFRNCGSTVQGLSIGWIDVYSKGLPDQNIDVTDVPEGEYWLESEVDPEGHVLESDETNNIARIKVTIPDFGDPGGGGGDPDGYEPNNSRTETANRPVGTAKSPNMGPAGPQTTVTDLSIHNSGDNDYYRFYMNHTGGSNDFVRIDFSHAAGDLDMQLLNAEGQVRDTSQGTSDSEVISMNGRGEGWYYLRVYGYNGATGSYSMTIDPSENSAPTISVLNPPAGDIPLIHGNETYDITWSASDPENDNLWVSVWANTSPTFDGNEVFLPTSINVPASQGFYIVNSAYLDPGTYYLHAQVTDGGSPAGDWSAGTVTFNEPACSPADVTTTGLSNGQGDGVVNLSDFSYYLTLWSNQNAVADVTTSGAANGIPDGSVDLSDFSYYLSLWSAGCP